MTMKTILKVQGLKKFFGSKKILDNINFSLDAGECLGIVGRSGCGKSTLVKIISRLIPCDGGKIIFCDDDITNLTGDDLRNIYKNMQMIFQMPEDSFNPRKTLGWSISEPMKNFGLKDVRERAKNLLIEVGLNENYFSRYPHEVSGGECQRAAIARAISLEPKILICDEATSALDVTVQKKIIELLKKFCTEKNISCLFVTHDIALLPKIADRVIVLHKGKIVEEGTPTKIIESPHSPFTKDLFASDFFARKKLVDCKMNSDR